MLLLQYTLFEGMYYNLLMSFTFDFFQSKYELIFFIVYIILDLHIILDRNYLKEICAFKFERNILLHDVVFKPLRRKDPSI